MLPSWRATSARKGQDGSCELFGFCHAIELLLRALLTDPEVRDQSADVLAGLGLQPRVRALPLLWRCGAPERLPLVRGAPRAGKQPARALNATLGRYVIRSVATLRRLRVPSRRSVLRRMAGRLPSMPADPIPVGPAVGHVGYGMGILHSGTRPTTRSIPEQCLLKLRPPQIGAPAVIRFYIHIISFRPPA
jgi:hypothetical protein